MDCSMPGFPVCHQLLELAQTHIHWVSDAIQPSHPLWSLYPPAFNLSQHQGFPESGFPSIFSNESDFASGGQSIVESFTVLYWKSKVLSFLWIFRTDFFRDWLVWSPCSPRDSQDLLQHHSLKVSILWCSAFFIMVQLSHPYMTTGKTIALARRLLLVE